MKNKSLRRRTAHFVCSNRNCYVAFGGPHRRNELRL